MKINFSSSASKLSYQLRKQGLLVQDVIIKKTEHNRERSNALYQHQLITPEMLEHVRNGLIAEMKKYVKEIRE